MAPSVWTLVLLLGAAWGQGHKPAPVWRETPLDWKPVVRRSGNSSVLTQCDFEDDSNPLCNWTQVSADDGDWTRTKGSEHNDTTGPPGGYPNKEGYYLHMDPRAFRQGGVARLRSPTVWEAGPLCVHFAYHMFGLSWGAQLKLLLLPSTQGGRPRLLWKHRNTQSTSWMPTAVTVPAGLARPGRLMFEAVRGSTAYLNIALDALSVLQGACHQVCVMQTCNFDTSNDLCGWSWIPTPTGAKWIQKTGSSGDPNVGPVGDFSRPGNGSYMLLDPKDAKSGQKSILLSPLSESSGCLSLSFHYILRARAIGAALMVKAAPLGSIQKHTLFSGQPGPNWQPVSVNYTSQGQIQFIIVGVFGAIPEPAVAVDAITIAPCGESFPQCDFEDDAHPFCDWIQVSRDGGHWTRGSRNTSTQGTGPSGGSPNGANRHYIYLKPDKFSQMRQPVRLVSRFFCALEAICVEFTYHLYDPGEHAVLKLLLGTPGGNATSSLWSHVGSQNPAWQQASITIPSGRQQPMQLIFEAVVGTTTTFDVAVGLILIHHGACRPGPMSIMLPGIHPVPPTIATEPPPVPTEKPTVPTEETTIPTEKCTTPTKKPTTTTEKTTIPTEKCTAPTEKPTIPKEKPTVPTEKPTTPTEKPIVPTERPTIPTEEPTAPIEEPIVPTEEPTVSTEKSTVPTEKPTIPTEKPIIPTEKATVPTEKPTVHTEEPIVLTEKPTTPTEKPTIPPEEPTVPTEKPTVATEKPTVHAEEPTVLTEKPTTPTEKPTILAEKPTIPTEKPTVHTEEPAVPTEEPTIPTEKPTISTEKPTVPTEVPTVPTEKPTVPTEKSTVPTEVPMVSTEKSTVPTEKPTVPTEVPTILTEKPTAPTEKPTILTEKPTILTETPTFSTEQTTITTETPTLPTEKPTIPTEKPIIPTEKPTLPTEKPILPTEKSTLPTEKPTLATEKPTMPTKKLTVPTEKPTEKPTIPTEEPTVPTEEPTVPTEELTVPTEEPTVPTEEPTVPTEKPTEKPTILNEEPTTPLEKSTLPTEKHTAPMIAYTSPTLKPIGPTILVMTPTAPSAFTTSVTLGTTATPIPAPATCPSDAHYESCACPASCENPRPTCQLPCRPGCVCNAGFLLSHSRCIKASSCNCFYNNNYYKPGAEWFSPNCTEHCRCSSGSHLECQASQCGTHKVCQLQNGQYGCHPYGTATCLAYGDPHYLTFDGRHFSFMGKCTYILTHPCDNSTDPYFRVAVKNEERGQEGVSCLSKVYVTLPQTTITLLKGRHTLVGGQQVTLPAMPFQGIFLTQSGRFMELQTAFGLRVRWDGDQQLYVTVTSTYFSRLCGFCGNYDGDSSNDNKKPDGNLARDDEELGNSWQIAGDEDKECQRNQASPPSCDSALHNSLLGPEFCGRLIDPNGIFGACLPHLKAFFYYESCLFDMCNFQGLQQMLCAQMAALTETCQAAGLMVKPWRSPQFCPLACPPNSRYSLCAKSCPETCHSGFSGMSCPDRCVEGCECNPGFVLSGLRCVPKNRCGCLQSPGAYFEEGESWYKTGCKQRCFCEGNNRIRCVRWSCGPREICVLQDGTYGCHAQGTGICTASGDPHYLTFDGALHHFMGTCTYTLTRPCWIGAQESYFTVSTTNENRGGNLEVSYIKAVHVQVFNLRLSLIKGRKVMLNDRRVSLPVWPAEGRMSVGLSGSFILLQTDFGLRVRYDGNHLVDVSVPSSFAGQLCGLCGNYNNNSLDDNLRPDRKPADSSVQLGAAWMLPSASEPGCFAAGGKPPSCPGKDMADIWNKNCEILINPQGPFSQCHAVVSPHPSFSSCVYGQCGTQGDTLTLCRSLQAYAALCAQAGRPPAWRNSTFCPLKCPSGSHYSPCASPCPTTCLSLDTPRDCPAMLPCAEGCECQKGHVLSGTSCVPLSQCGCTDQQGSYHPVGERWYADSTCSRLCTCSSHNNISCSHTSCSPNQMCWPLDGLLRCRAAGMGVCHVSGDPNYVSFDGSYHSFRGTCTYILVQVCHPNMDLPFFKISAKNEKQGGETPAFYLHHVNIYIYGSHITLQKDHHVLIDGKPVTLPATTQIRRVSITAKGIYTVLSAYFGLLVKFDGSHLLEIQIPRAYYQKVCGMCGNFNGEEEDELMMPDDELAQNDVEFGNSWKDKDDSDPSCQRDDQEVRLEHRENPNTNCKPDDLVKAQQRCQAAFQGSGWSECATQVVPKPFLIGCTYNLCELRGENRAICDALQAFGVACQAQGLTPPFWRNNSFCPLECPAYSSYTHCAPSCPPSCGNLKGQCEGTKLLSTCFEGCICNPGYVLSDDQCVLRNQCSCKDAKGGILPAGKTWLSIGCTQSCVCTEGVIQCRIFHCPSGSHCQPNAKGNSNCVPDWLDHCSVSGDPHYRTLDGLSYHFQGRMTYTLVKTMDVLPDGVEPLVVEGRNKMYLPWSPVFLHEVLVYVYGFRIQLQRGLEVVVNYEKVAIPYKPSEHLQVSLRSHRLYLTTDFGLSISFDGNKNAVISMPSMYQGLVRGMCGNFDRNQSNDLMLPSGAITHNINIFGNSWEVKTVESTLARVPRAIQVEEEEVEEGESGFHVSECSPEQLELINSTQACRVLADPKGPFAACHQTVVPEPFQEHCVFDLCAAQNPRELEELRCQLLSGYALICQEAGAALAGWRDHTGCALACPANTVYQSCMTPCPASCANLAAPRDCEGPCVEGCASLPGYIYSGAQSLPLADCGCINDGIYYQRGDSFVTKDCSQRCTCASSGVLLCKPLSCSTGEICTLGNLTRGCFRESPCLQNPCQNDGRCREQGTSFTCECELGYGGDLCNEPRDVLPPEKLEGSNFVAVLLGMLVPMAFIVLAVTRKYLHRKRRRREKMTSQNLDRPVDMDFVPERAFKVAQF